MTLPPPPPLLHPPPLPLPPLPNPKLTLTLGIFGSASTWVYTAVQLLLARNAGTLGPLFASFADSEGFLTRNVSAILAASVCVFKLHRPDETMLSAAKLANAALILSIRDPRDCVVSMMDRFGWELAEAEEKVVASVQAVLLWSQHFAPLALRYEDDFTANPQTVAALAARLGLPADPQRDAEITASLSAATLSRALAKRAAGEDAEHPALALPRGAWHTGHVGDGRRGKFAERLAPDDALRIEQKCWQLMRRYGYPLSPQIQLQPGVALGFAKGQTGVAFLGKGFRSVDRGGIWSERAEAEIELPLLQTLQPTALHFELMWTSGDSSAPRLPLWLWVNDVPHLLLTANHDCADKLRFALSLPISLPLPTDALNLRFAFADQPDQTPLILGAPPDSDWHASKPRIGVLSMAFTTD